MPIKTTYLVTLALDEEWFKAIDSFNILYASTAGETSECPSPLAIALCVLSIFILPFSFYINAYPSA